MKLKKLELENFKGVKTFVLDLADGKNAAVFGDNHTGKTTLMDAYFWLLLGKNAEGRADFAVKTEGTKALDYGVTGTFLHEGRTVVLRRVLREQDRILGGRCAKKRAGIQRVPAGMVPHG